MSIYFDCLVSSTRLEHHRIPGTRCIHLSQEKSFHKGPVHYDFQRESKYHLCLRMLRCYRTLLQRIHSMLKFILFYFCKFFGLKTLRTYGIGSCKRHYSQSVLHHHNCRREDHQCKFFLFFWFLRHIYFRCNPPRQPNEKDLKKHRHSEMQASMKSVLHDEILTSSFVAN